VSLLFLWLGWEAHIALLPYTWIAFTCYSVTVNVVDDAVVSYCSADEGRKLDITMLLSPLNPALCMYWLFSPLPDILLLLYPPVSYCDHFMPMNGQRSYCKLSLLIIMAIHSLLWLLMYYLLLL
jgi:hypothetical protein